MARYVVVEPFADIYDGFHDYYVGDVFPHDGRFIDPTRINSLATNANNLGKPLIRIAEEVTKKSDKKKEVVKDEPEVKENTETESEKSYTKSEVNRMPLAKLKEVASEIGIDGTDEKTGGELKKLIIEKLGL